MRKLIVLALTAMAVMATMAPTAQADFAFEMSDPDTQAACNPCVVENMDGDWTLLQPGFGAVATCPLTFDMRFQEDGSFAVENQVGSSCSGIQRRPCTVGGQTVGWPGTPLAGPQFKIDMCFERSSDGGGDFWEEVTFNPVLDGSDRLIGLDQSGQSENNYIVGADFDNHDQGEGFELTYQYLEF